ncbi:MAG: hypothetical protein PWQ91_907 [Eubacteriales bacterium]|nr:hypothetical protein [Eubacteriales bacterium]MDN5363846.1 hypothetical protein [Eubacteriales bacterium]
MEIKEMQEIVDRWISQFEEGYWPPGSMMMRFIEETGELCRELNHRYGHKPKKADEPEGDVAEEIGDVLFVLVCLANSLGIDLEEAFRGVMEKYYRRDLNRWTRKKEETEGRKNTQQ